MNLFKLALSFLNLSLPPPLSKPAPKIMFVYAYCIDAETNAIYMVHKRGEGFAFTIQKGSWFFTTCCIAKIGGVLKTRHSLGLDIKYDSLDSMLSVNPNFKNVANLKKLLADIMKNKNCPGSGGIRSGN